MTDPDHDRIEDTIDESSPTADEIRAEIEPTADEILQELYQ